MGNVKIVFVPNVWVKCIFKNNICLGRTLLEKSKQFIALITDSGIMLKVPFHEVQTVAILKILTVQQFENHNALDQIEHYSLTHILAVHQLNSLMS